MNLPSSFKTMPWLWCVVLLTGCAQTGERLLSDAHIVYTVPTGWVVEDFPDHRGVFSYALTRPDEVEASIGIELTEIEDIRDAHEIVEGFVASEETTVNSSSRTQTDQSIGHTQKGLVFGRIDYRVSRSGGDYLDSTYVIPISSKFRLYIFTSVFESERAKYLATVDAFLNSISVAP